MDVLDNSLMDSIQRVLRCVFEAGPDVNSPNRAGITPLHTAVNHDNVVVVRALIEAGAGVNSPDSDGTTPLLLAVHRENISVVNALIVAGADVNTPDHDGRTPLHIAVSNDDIEIVNALIEAGVDVNIRDRKGTMPLHICVKNGNIEIVKALIGAGADVNIPNRKGLTAVQIVVAVNNVEMLNVLIEAGADVNFPDDNGTSPLHVAVNREYAETVKALIEAGADVNLEDNNTAMTPLCIAALGGVSDSNITIVNALIEAGANVNHQSRGRTALLFAANRCNFPVVNALIEASVRVSTRDISSAVQRNNEFAIVTLLDAYVKNSGFDDAFMNEISVEYQLQAVKLRPSLALQYLFSYFDVENSTQLLQTVINECCSPDVDDDREVLHLAIEKLVENHYLCRICHICALTSQNIILNNNVVCHIMSYLSPEDIEHFIQAMNLHD